MDVLNRLKSAVTNVLPVGNPINTDFEIHSHRASGGPGMLWKVYDGIFKSTKQEASIFFFEKKQLDRFSRREREVLLDCLKKGVSQLTKLRHPKILSVVHPLEESRESLAFATEPIFSSLANVLGFHDNLPHPPPPYLKDFSLSDVETRYGLLQIVEGLAFLHGSAKIIHGNCCPESVFINKLGCWKLAGFEYCIINANAQGEPYYPYREYDQNSDPSTQPKLNYLAPEFGLTGCCDVSSDLFSFGMMIYAIYNKGSTLYDCMSDWRTYKLNASDLRNLTSARLSEIPGVVRDHVKLLFNIDSTLRPDADQLSKIPYFEEVAVVTLRYLDLLVQKDNLQKSQFFKDLTPIVSKLPKRVNLQRVLPSVARECHNMNMVPFILPTILEIAKMSTNEEYASHVLPVIIPLLKITEPIQVMLIMIQNMTLLLNKTSQADIRNYVLPFISKALEVNIPQMQDMCLNIMPTFAGLVEYTSLKNSIIPRICKLCLAQTSLSIKVNCLICLGKLLEYLDKWFVLDEVLPVLQTINSKEPAILMSILGIYKIALTHKKLGITKEIIANKILPFIIPVCIENTLNLSQFNSFMSVVKEMISQMETEHRTKLEQLDSMQQEQKTLQKFAQESVQAATSMDVLNVKNGLSQLDHTFNPFDVTNKQTFNSGVKINKKPVALTMEEKEKLARQQEFENRCKTSEVPLQPATSRAPAMKTAPRDLTSTLINNNLNMLSVQSQAPRTSFSPHQGFHNSTFPNYSALSSVQPRINSSPTRPSSSAFDSIPTGINPKVTRSQPMLTIGSGVQSASPINFAMNSVNVPANNWLNNSTPHFTQTNNNAPQVKQNLSTKDIQDLLG